MRVTLVFAAVMALVLAAVGVFLYYDLSSQLNASIDQGLRSRAGELARLMRSSSPTGGRDPASVLSGGEESLAQVMTPGGRVIGTTPRFAGEPVLTASDLNRAQGGAVFFSRPKLRGVDGPARLLAAPVDVRGRRLMAVVGSSQGDRDDALRNLADLLLIGGPVALLLASLAGYGAAVAALRPVEAMRRRAGAISAAKPDERLPVPPARDELSRLAETLNQMLGRLEATLERERRFVDDASHELRTPLALHKAELELALRHGDDVEGLRAAIGAAIGDVDRLNQLAEALLVLARSEKGRVAVELERCDLGELFGSMLDRFGGRAEQLGRPLVLDPVDGLAIEADRLRLGQALGSLIDNALRYGNGEVRLWARQGEGAVELHVGDRGPGFPAEFIEHAFERFSRADTARSRGGSGLGLAIVEAIARSHGGEARAENRGGGGADVWIEVRAVPV